jgi:pyruvate dehydrogenase E2 component (dihydrolipoamide acetyltransferase)
MATEVIMPKVDMDQETGTVVEWLKKDGETVEKGEIILVIETDKVAIEVESPAAGILNGIRAEPGEVIPIAQVIAYVLEPGEALPPEEEAAPPAAAPRPRPATPEAVPPPASDVAVTPVARNLAAASGVDLAGVTGSGPRGKVTKTDAEAALAPSGNGAGRAGVVNATPAARRIAREEAVDLAALHGNGPGGRVQASDVLAAAASPARVPDGRPERDVEVVPLQGMRRMIAERMTASYQQAPHITFTARVDMSRFSAAREELNAHAEAVGAARISATALIVKAVGLALTRHPWLNSALHGEEIHLRRDVNVGVAVALEEGLIVPVVRDADRKGVSAIAAEVTDLAARARAGQLVPSDVSDGTFTVSNLGPFGVEQFTAIINPPQAAILAVGATQQEAVPDEDGQIVARPIMRMTLSADHRIVDGATAAHFIADLKAMLETPTLLSL